MQHFAFVHDTLTFYISEARCVGDEASHNYLLLLSVQSINHDVGTEGLGAN